MTVVDRLSGLDASFLYFESPTNQMHVCGLLLLDGSSVPGGYSFEALKSTLQERVSRSSAFRRKVHAPRINLDHPVWVEDDDFDIDQHLHRTTVPAPGTAAELNALCGEIAERPIERDRPLWEMWIIEGLADGRVGLFSKMHHATVDGVSGGALITELCSIEADGPALVEMPEYVEAMGAAPVLAEERPSDIDIAVDGLAGVVRKPLQLLELVPHTVGVVRGWIDRTNAGRAMPAPFTAPRTSFNDVISEKRCIAYTRVDLDEVKQIKNAFGATVNDVVLTTCSGALRRYLARRAELPTESLVSMVPVSMHGKSIRELGTNKISGMFSSLSTDIADPVERLAVIAERNRIAKEHHSELSADIMQDWAEFAGPVASALLNLYRRFNLASHHPVIHNLVVSNVPGPPMPLYFLGARIVGFYPFGPIFDGAGLNVTVMSYAGHVEIGLIGCPDLLPYIDDLAECFDVAFEELLEAARATA